MRLLYTLLFLGIISPASGQVGWNVSLLGNWTDTAEVPLNRSGFRYNDVWGFVQGGREYAALGSTLGVHIIDVNSAKQVAFQPGTSDPLSVVHRDYKTFGGYLYAVCDEGDARLQVFDLRYLPDSLHLVYESRSRDFARSHNIFIDTASARLYACAMGFPSGEAYSMGIYALDTPARPELLRFVSLPDLVHDVFVRNDTAYASCANFGYLVVDCRNPASTPIIGGLLLYPYKGYNHSSWIGPDGLGVMADESFGLPVKVIDARDVNDIQVYSSFAPRPGNEQCIPHNPYLVGHHAFISYYTDGFQVYDLSNPREPRQAGYYHTYQGPPVQGLVGAWGCYPFLPSGRVLVSDMLSGLFVLDADAALGKVRSAHFSIYPNPADEKLYLNIPAAGMVSIQLLDMQGRVVSRWEEDAPAAPYLPLTIPLPTALPAGLYVISASGAWGQGTRVFHKK